MKPTNGRLKWISALVGFVLLLAGAIARVEQNAAAVKDLKAQNGDIAHWVREVDQRLSRIEGFMERLP